MRGSAKRSAGLLAAVLAAVLGGCAYYSFTGATIPANLNTVAVPLTEDNSTSPLLTMAEELTELLIDRFVGQTRLVLEPDETAADALLVTTITRYVTEPAAVGADERATLNRVNISVAARYTDRTEDEVLLERTFSAFGEYDPVAEGLDGEREAARTALERIADDIFTAATSNW